MEYFTVKNYLDEHKESFFRPVQCGFNFYSHSIQCLNIINFCC